MKLRKLTKDDLPERVRWMNSPMVYKTMHFTPPISLENTVDWYKKNQSCTSRCDVVFEDDQGRLIAMGGLTSIDYTVRKAEFYIFVNPSRQKEGIGTTATRILCKYGFEVLNLHKIYLYTNRTNLGAKKTYEKVGFRLEGIHRDELVAEEMYDDRLYYGLLASEFVQEISLEFKGWNDIQIDHVTIDNHEICLIRDDCFPKLGGGYKVS